MSILSTLDLTRRFGEFTAVDAATLDVAPGEVFGLLGPNGAGKSTTIKMLTTLLPSTSGTGEIAGFDLARRSADVRRAIGYVPQALSADGTLTGYENLLLSSTGLADAATLAARFGFDLRTPEFWRASLDVARGDIARFEALVARQAGDGAR